MDTDETEVSAEQLFADRLLIHTQFVFHPFICSQLGCCLLRYSGAETVICGSEQVTACICVKSFDDAEQKGVQVPHTARHSDEVIEMSLCFCHGLEIPESEM